MSSVHRSRWTLRYYWRGRHDWRVFSGRGASRWDAAESQAWRRPLRRRNWRCQTGAPLEQPRTVAPSRDARLARLEAVLFLTREPVSSRKLAQFAGLADGTEARTLIRRLNRLYDQDGSAFRAEEVGGGFQLLSRPKFGNWLRRLHRVPVEVRLSSPALESLAVVAYRQPVLRADIEAIRGVDCSEILRQLMDRDLVRIVGRSHELGRPYLYGTTRRFLQYFGLRHLDDLPRAGALRPRPPEPVAACAGQLVTKADSNPKALTKSQTDHPISTNASEDQEEFPSDHDSPT